MSVAACPGCAMGPPPVARNRPAPAKMRTIRLSVPDIHCAGCIASVERAAMTAPGVRSARVNLSQKRLTADVTPEGDEESLIAALARAGRASRVLNSDMLAAEDDPTGRRLLSGLGVSGFAMMNVMLLSVSVWSGAEAATRELLHWISAAIALPAVVFSARPFLAAAWAALSHRRLSMVVPIAVAIALAAAMSLYETAHGGAHAYFDAALSLTFFLLLGRYLDHRSRIAARSAAKELSALEAAKAGRLTDDGDETVGVETLRPGDVLRVAPGMRAPVDGVAVSEASDLDRSHLTGESIPETVRAGDVVESGALVLTAPLVLRATATGDDTSLRRMADMIEAAEAGRAKYVSLADRAAKIYAPAVHLLSLAAFIGWMFATQDARLALNIAVAVLIITCPCALGLAAPAVATAAAGALFRRGVLLKNGDALERLAEVDVVAFDKTGTLTTGQPQAILTAENRRSLAVAAALAARSAHPFAKALAKAAEAEGVDIPVAEDVREAPGRGVEGRVEGSPTRFGAGDWVCGHAAEKDHIGASAWFRIGDQAPVRFGFAETTRPGAAKLIESLKARGLDVMLLSGDGWDAVARLADDLGVDAREARLSPFQKTERLRDMASAGRRVLMVGDGLNDAAALAAAHVSVAPASALDCARVASDIVLLSDDLTAIDDALRLSKGARRRVLENFGLATLYNLVAVPVALMGFATPLIAALAMSASSISVSLNALRASR